jgi:hypothetical protein
MPASLRDEVTFIINAVFLYTALTINKQDLFPPFFYLPPHAGNLTGAEDDACWVMKDKILHMNPLFCIAPLGRRLVTTSAQKLQ